MDENTKNLAIVGAIMLAVGGLLMSCFPAKAHTAPSGWKYPPGCCRDHNDCHVMQPGMVVVDGNNIHVNIPPGYHPHAPNGWKGIYDKRAMSTKYSGDGFFHVCISAPTPTYPDGIHRCNYITEPGF